jgi:hypothetical protein
MDRKTAIHSLLSIIAFELLQYIKDRESSFEDRWVPAADIRNELELNFLAVPRQGEQYGEKGWLFAILARMLEEQELVEYRKDGSRAFYRSTRPGSDSMNE